MVGICHKGKAFFKVAFGVILFLIFGSIIQLPPTLHKWCLIIGIPLWFIKWIKDFAVNIPKQVRENNVKKACEELAKILFQR